MQETNEPLELVERVAAIDIGKSGLVVCVRVSHDDKPGRRCQEVREYTTLTASLLALADWLRCQSVTLVAMEATSDYWKPVYYLLEAEGFTCWLLNAKHVKNVKNVPGRPKTDKLDAVWLAKVVERGMCRPSLVHPKPIRQLRDLTRYRRSLVRERTREKQRVEKLLEDAQIKLSSVISDIFGVSGRQMLAALIDGQRDPKTLAQMARGPMRSKVPVLQEALTGHFTDEHGFRLMLNRIDDLTATIEAVSRLRVSGLRCMHHLDEIPMQTSGTARSRPRWTSAARCLPRPPGRRSRSWASNWNSRCCTALLYGDQKKATSRDGKWPLTWVELRGFEPLTPSMRSIRIDRLAWRLSWSTGSPVCIDVHV
ncbi:IS110 family transposase [Sphaerisporangium perillae]|uniref:IS110 family transposase n=1 Tax=Sphaerisporangium perillae TaxID=2935860 RepID=UPI00200F3AB8|nr:IS110 family transposase [Sphaerisporangium perillae]